MSDARIQRLLAATRRDFAVCHGSRLTDQAEQTCLARIAGRVYRETRDLPEVVRKAAFLEAFARDMPIRIRADERIIGSQRFALPPWDRVLGPDGVAAMAFRGNMGHIVVDYARILRRGVAGLRHDLADMPVPDETSRENRTAFQRVLKAFALFIKRHAKAAAAEGRGDVAGVCTRIAEHPPGSFHEALQLTWLTQVFLHAESPSTAAISFGRFDQFAWPFLQHDLAEGALDIERARELLSCFWLKCCEGDESQNLVVGGCDTQGNNAENALSLLCLDVCRALRVWQPSVSVRLREDSSPAFCAAARALAAEGFGMPSFLNDPPVIRALCEVGIPLDRARDYGIVGCYEATPQGDCIAYTVAGRILLPQLMHAFLEPALGFSDYEAFETAFRTGVARASTRSRAARRLCSARQPASGTSSLPAATRC